MTPDPTPDPCAAQAKALRQRFVEELEKCADEWKRTPAGDVLYSFTRSWNDTWDRLISEALQATADAARAAQREKLEHVLHLLDTALGDTDPANEPDEEEDPVFWAYRYVSEILRAQAP